MFRKETIIEGGAEKKEQPDHFFNSHVFSTLTGRELFDEYNILTPEDAKIKAREAMQRLLSKQSLKNQELMGIVDEFRIEGNVRKARVLWSCTDKNLEGEELRQEFQIIEKE